MTMAKKGRRKIVVGDKVYYYIVKKVFEHGYYGYRKASVTIEAPDGKIYADKSEHNSIKPSYVRALVLKHLV